MIMISGSIDSVDVTFVACCFWQACESKQSRTMVSTQSFEAKMSLWLSSEILEKHGDRSPSRLLPIIPLLTPVDVGLTSLEDDQNPLSSSLMSSAERKSFGEMSASDNDCTTSGLYSTPSKKCSSYHCENAVSDVVVESALVASRADSVITDKFSMGLVVDSTAVSISLYVDPVVTTDSTANSAQDSCKQRSSARQLQTTFLCKTVANNVPLRD